AKARARRVPRRTAGERALHELLDVFLEDAALGTRSGDVGDIDAELTCEAANAGTRVGGNGAFARADRKRGRGGGWHRRRRRGGGRCGGEARCDRRGRLRARRGGRRTLGRRRGGGGGRRGRRGCGGLRGL